MPEAGQVGHKRTYVVDYDLPADSRRKKFYRSVSKFLRDHYAQDTGWSTYSVVFTPDPEFAYFVYHAALRVGGRANIYEARRLDPMELTRAGVHQRER